MRESLGAATRSESDRCDADLRAALADLLSERDGIKLAEAFASAPDAVVYRHLWRELAEVEAAVGDGAMRTLLFAMPLVIVAGVEGEERAAVTLPGVLADADAVVVKLREHGALGGNRTFAMSSALVSADSLDLRRLPRLLASRALPDRSGAAAAPPDLPPAPIPVTAGHESVHLRFLVGVAMSASGVDLLAVPDDRKWAIPLAQLVGASLAVPGTTLLALPGAPQRLVPALQTGRALQREVSAQVFLSNALRKMRASTGEPSVVISAHRTPDAASGGELRMSLSSPFAPRDAEGFRCPLYPVDRVADVVQMLTTLLRDCRVADVRTLGGVHADRDMATGAPLLFRADTLH